MLRFVVNALVANLMLVRCNSDVPISLVCLIAVSNGLDHCIIRTTPLRNLKGLRSGR